MTRWYALHFPSDLQAEAVLHFARSLAARPRRGWMRQADPVACEASSTDGRLRWRLGASQRDADRVLTSLRLALPDVRVEPDEGERPSFERGWELRLNSQRRALRTDAPEQVAAGLLSALAETYRGEAVCLQWLIGPWLSRPVVPPATTIKRASGDLLDFGRPMLDSEATKALRDKQTEPLFGVVGRLAVKAASSGREAVLRQRVVGALQLVRAPGVGFERRLIPSRWVPGRLDRLQAPAIDWPCVLNASELVSCLGWPVGNPVIGGVSYSGGRQLPPPHAALVRSPEPNRHRITGQATFPGQEGSLSLSVSDALHHLHVIGPTGTGKSTLLANLALQDIAAGRSAVVIDPKRDLVHAIADRIPSDRLGDVVLLEPTDERPVGLNVLKGSPDEVIVDGITHVLHELYAAHWGPRTADVIHNGLLSLARVGGMTLCELPPLLLNAPFRRHVTKRLRSDALGVAPFWAWFESLSEPERASVIAPALNKLRAFTNRQSIRRVIGQTEGFDLMELFTKRKVLLVSLAKDQVGAESAHLFGALLLGQLWATIQRRSGVAPEKRHPVFVYVDEFGEIMRLPVSMPDALAASRGLGVGWVLAHQDLSQLSTSTKAAMLANMRSRIAFQAGHDDATVLARSLGVGLTPADLTGLGAFETYQALCVGGRVTSPASAITHPLSPSLGTFDAVRENSRSQYGQERSEVDAELLRRRTVEPETDVPIGSRKRGGRS